jgi:hypothetical protein
MRIRKLLTVTAMAAAAVLGSIGPATAEDEESRGSIVQTASGNDQPGHAIGRAMSDSLPGQYAKSPQKPGLNRVGGIVQSQNPVEESPDQGEKADGERAASLLGRLLG